MIRRYAAELRLALMTADLLSAVVLFVAISIVRFGDRWQESWARLRLDPWLVALLYALIWLGALLLQGMYRPRSRWTIRSEAFDILRATVLLAVALFSVLFVAKLPDVSRLFLAMLLPAQALLTILSRVALRLGFAFIRARGYNARFMLIIGTGPAADAFANEVEAHAELGTRVIGHLRAPGETTDSPPQRSVLGDLDAIESVLHDQVVDEVAICLPPSQLHLAGHIARLCEEEGKIVRIPVEEGDPVLPGGRLEEFEGMRVLSLVYGPDRTLSLILKRLLDVVGATIGLVLLSPLLLTVAVVILARDGTPILFRQVRVGLHGRPFRVVKFRTMVPDAEARLRELEALNEIRGLAFKMTDDPRMTRIGRFLRRTSIDELPQLWNVLRGEMSLVGPRPPLPSEVAAYDVWHRRRLSMKPGITGLWQVKARRESEFDRWVEIDLDYIDSWSLWLDVKIIARTIPAMLTGEGR
jgi:exopolysaccharide biosynthesis polyprenyl glycosylphosphotransferase